MTGKQILLSALKGHVAFSANVPDTERLSQAIDRAARKDQRPA